jgi:hypothetical protein
LVDRPFLIRYLVPEKQGNKPDKKRFYEKTQKPKREKKDKNQVNPN